MRGSIQLPFGADAFALCGESNVALYDADSKRITEWAHTDENGLVEIKPLLSFPVDTSKILAKSDWSVWRMAENAPVVVTLLRSGMLGVLKPRDYAEYPQVVAQRIVQVDSGGHWVYLQCRQDIIKVDLDTGNVMQTHRLTGCAYETSTHKAYITAGKLHVEHKQTTYNTALAASTWLPIGIHIGAQGSVYVLNMSRKNTSFFTQIHEWKLGTNLQCVKTVTFEHPTFAFTTVGPNERWCCSWPKQGGFVVQDADGYGNSITCKLPPVQYANITAYTTPQDPKRLILS